MSGRKPVTVDEAYARCPDMVKGQKFLGTHKIYKFQCDVHGEYAQTFNQHDLGRGCRQCAFESFRKSAGMVGKRFGRQVVESEAGRSQGGEYQFNCLCDCGLRHVVGGCNLRKGRSTQCKKCAAANASHRAALTTERMYARHPDLMPKQVFRGRKEIYKFWCTVHGEYLHSYDSHAQGKRCKKCAIDKLRRHPEVKVGGQFGQWFVEARVENRGVRSQWRVRCVCGRIKIIEGQRLHRMKQCHICSGRTEAGLIPALSPRDGARNDVLCSTKLRAKMHNRVWELSDELFDLLSQSPCYYCGDPPSNQRRGGAYIYSGIDRVDSSEGYTPANSVACCKNCNWVKSDRNVVEFENHIKKIARHLETRNARPSSSRD